MRTSLATLVAALSLLGTASAQTPTPNAAQLVAAVKAGESATALSLLQRKADPNAAEVDGTTALHWAVRNGDVTLLDRLLRAGAKADAANRYGVTALPLACQQGDPAIVERLLNAGLSANLTGPLGETALHTCARSGHVAAAKMLVTRGASLDAVESWRGQTPIMWAAAQGHGEMVAMLAEAGADVNARSGIIAWERQRTSEPRDKWLPPGGFTPLLFAAREGRVDAAKALIAAGADVSAIASRPAVRARHRAHQRPLRRRQPAHRQWRGREHARQGGPDRSVGGGGLQHAAAVQPAGAESVRRG